MTTIREHKTLSRYCQGGDSARPERRKLLHPEPIKGEWIGVLVVVVGLIALGVWKLV